MAQNIVYLEHYHIHIVNCMFEIFRLIPHLDCPEIFLLSIMDCLVRILKELSNMQKYIYKINIT